MKKILSVFTSAVMILCGCSTVKVNAGSETTEQNSITETYSADDLTALQDFILAKESSDCNKNYDLNGDDRLDVFDVCLMRDKISPDNSSDILVTYFSCTGNTETIAKYMADYLNADTYEIVAEEPYTEDDLKYYTDCRADREQNDPSARPAISGTIENIDDYETIFIGYPIWHGQAPRIISTFLESYDFSGKTIVPFCTSASSGIGSSDTNLHSLAEDADWISGKRFPSSAAENDVTNWLDTLPLQTKEDTDKMNIEVNGHVLTATLENNSSAKALAEMIKSEPLTINMSDYADFEKVGSLGTSLPRNDEQITTEAGDLILYQGNSFVIYYDVNSWNFTRLGRIDNITQTELKEILGDGDVTVTLSVSDNK